MINYQSVHFVGVLTPEMASLAVYTAKLNIKVSGSSESAESIYSEPLRSSGVTLYEMFAQLNVAKHVELVVLSRYYDTRHVEADAALRLKIPVVSETDYIRLITEGKSIIALLGEYESRIAATYIDSIFTAAGIPVSSLTTTVPNNSSAHLARVTEADQFILPLSGFKRDASTYEADFLSFSASIAGIPAIRYDYPELNTTLDDVYQSYYAFAKRIPRRGIIVGNNDYSRMKRLRGHLADRSIQTYGEERDTSWHIETITPSEKGTSFILKNEEHSYGPYTIPFYNLAAVSAVACAVVLSLASEISSENVNNGVIAVPALKRLSETAIDPVGRTIIDDQADHPELIEDMIQSIRAHHPTKKIWCLYQAGSYLRTKTLFNDLAQALSHADFVYLAGIAGYPREKTEGIDIRHLVAFMNKTHTQTYFFHDAQAMAHLLSQRVTSTDCIVTLGIEGICQQSVHPLIESLSS